jgi:Predicted hydrolases or acyltransferases (alpha/beta hydrolase superfamily)
MIKKNTATNISYELIGNEECGETLLFIHGAGGNMFALRAIATLLPEYKCVLLDLPGHNRSEGEVPETVEKLAEIIENFIISERNILGDNITCVGHSMGGAISLLLAIRKVSAVKRLVILNSGAAIAVDKKFMDNVKKGKIDKGYLFRCSGSFLNIRTYQFFITGFKQMITSQKVMIKDFLAVEKYDCKKDVKKITLPTLIMTGEKEILARVEYSKYLHSQIKGSKLFIMKKVAHLMPIIIPEKVTEKMKDFLKNS